MTKYFLKIFIDLCFQLRKTMFQGIDYPLFFFKRKRNLALTIQVHHEDPFSLFTINLGREEGLGDFLRLDERPSVQATQNKQKWNFLVTNCVVLLWKIQREKNKRTFYFWRNLTFGLPWFVCRFMHTFWVPKTHGHEDREWGHG